VPRTPERRSPDLRPLLAREPAPFAALTPAGREALLSAAARHGLLAAVSGRLPADDPALRSRFERLAAANRLRDGRLREALEEVLAILGAAGIMPVALKGPAFADRVYPDPALRAATDLDLLVPEAVLPRAAEALVAAGFARAPALQDAYQRARHHHLHLHRDAGPDVELHFRAVSAFGAVIPTPELVARARPHHTARGTPLLALAPEDEAIALAVHAAAHLLERGGWLLDLVLLIERTPALDWAAIRTRVDAWGCRRAVAYVLGRLRELGAPVPEGAVPGPRDERRRLADRLARAALARRGRAAAVLRMAFRATLRDRLAGLPAAALAEAGWAVRRRAHLLARGRTHSRARRGDVGPPSSSPSRPDDA
jgi:hypothetical protein